MDSGRVLTIKTSNLLYGLNGAHERVHNNNFGVSKKLKIKHLSIRKAFESTNRPENQVETLWASQFDKMDRKTLIESLIYKFGIMFTDMQDAMKSDRSSLKIDFDIGDKSIEYLDNSSDEVLGTPRSKHRPRICNFQGRKFSYNPKKQKNMKV